MKSRLQTFLLAAALLLLPAAEGLSQVVVYKFDFAKTGPSINYGFYDEGWVVADATGGPADWVLTFREGALRYYITVDDFGSLFYANNGDHVSGVISASAADGTPQTTFLAIGDVNTSVKGLNVSVKVPQILEGVAQSADDESDVPFDTEEGDRGYAGISNMKGSLQQQRTDDANSQNLTTDETFTELVAYLERRGYVLFEVEDPGDGTGDGNGDGTGDGNGDGTGDGTDGTDGGGDTGDGATAEIPDEIQINTGN